MTKCDAVKKKKKNPISVACEKYMFRAISLHMPEQRQPIQATFI